MHETETNEREHAARALPPEVEAELRRRTPPDAATPAASERVAEYPRSRW
jgi:hypothetical protein